MTKFTIGSTVSSAVFRPVLRFRLSIPFPSFLFILASFIWMARFSLFLVRPFLGPPKPRHRFPRTSERLKRLCPAAPLQTRDAFLAIL